jgi:hypothetical protein
MTEVMCDVAFSCYIFFCVMTLLEIEVFTRWHILLLPFRQITWNDFSNQLQVLSI